MVGAQRRPGGEGKATHPHVSYDLLHSLFHVSVGDPHGHEPFAAEHGIAHRQMTQAEFTAFVASDVQTIGGLVRSLGITAQ